MQTAHHHTQDPDYSVKTIEDRVYADNVYERRVSARMALDGVTTLVGSCKGFDQVNQEELAALLHMIGRELEVGEEMERLRTYHGR